MAQIPESPSAREQWWAERLEPSHGAQFRVFVQNPAALNAGADVRDQLVTIRVSQRPARFKLETLKGKTISVFGDHDLYIANYLNKPVYETTVIRPYLACDPKNKLFEAFSRPPDWFSSAGPTPETMADGRYDRIEPDLNSAPAKSASVFGVAMTYALARRAVDIWKLYTGRSLAAPFPWHFAGPPPPACGSEHPRLELIPLVKETASSRGASIASYGYICLGVGHPDELDEISATAPLVDVGPERSVPYFLSPDVVAHECGHQILYAELGFGPNLGATMPGPAPDWRELWGANGPFFRAFHEAFGDIFAILVALHSKKFRSDLLAATEGDIFSVNTATAIGELSPRKTIRKCFNNRRTGDADIVAMAPRFENYYALSEIVSGALFDILVWFGLRRLQALGGVRSDLVKAWEDEEVKTHADGTGSTDEPHAGPSEKLLADAVRALFRGGGVALIDAAMIGARDDLGNLLAHYLASAGPPGSFDPAAFTFSGLRRGLQASASKAGLPIGNAKAVVATSFGWRGIRDA